LTSAWASERFSVIEVPLAPGDVSPILRGFVQAFSARVRSS